MTTGSMVVSMPDCLIVSSPTREVLNESLRATQPHLRPILFAVRDKGCRHLFVMQGPQPFPVEPSGAPVIAIIGDDTVRSVGPDGFHRKSLRRLVKSAAVAVVMVGLSDEAYLEAASWAVLKRKNVVIVETRTAHELVWTGFLRDLNPDLGVLVVLDRSERPNA